jgi:protease-4
MSKLDSIGQMMLILTGTLVAIALGVVLFGVIPAETSMGIWAVVLITLLTVAGLVVSGRIAGQIFAAYNVAEVNIDGAIVQSGDGPSPLPGGGSAAADELVEQIEQADADENVDALVLNMNTPGGEVVASEDIRYAAEQFDGPTVAYATSLCASGGMWIASGCDEFHAREGSRIGSIGVIGAVFGKEGTLDKLGLEYNRFVAGDYKDTTSGLRELREDEREYWQGLLDEWYDQFIETVVEGRDIDAETARDTEARIYLGPEAKELGLVDTLGPREEMEQNLQERIDADDLEIEEFEPERGIQDQLSVTAIRVARGFGRGVASVFVDDGHPKGRV